MSTINRETGNPLHKDLAYVGALALAVAAGTLLLALILKIYSVSADIGGTRVPAGAAIFGDLSSANVIIAIACAFGGAVAQLSAAVLYARGRVRPRQ